MGTRASAATDATSSYTLQEQTQEEVIASVEKMLAKEKDSSIKAFAKNTAAAEFDLNEGIVSVKKKETKAPKPTT